MFESKPFKNSLRNRKANLQPFLLMQPPFPLSERIWTFFVEDSTPLGRLDAILFVMFKASFPRHQSPRCSAFGIYGSLSSSYFRHKKST